VASGLTGPATFALDALRVIGFLWRWFSGQTVSIQAERKNFTEEKQASKSRKFNICRVSVFCREY
jgi:hypothetical protein